MKNYKKSASLKFYVKLSLKKQLEILENQPDKPC